MPIDVKICGINAPDALAAAVTGGARFVGFVFYRPSPRCVTPAQAAALAADMPDGVARVGLFVDPEDAMLEAACAVAPLDIIQLHGREAPERVRQVRARFGRPVIKVIGVATAADLDRANEYLDVADRLMFDAKPPKGQTDALPGGNAQAFDWDLLAGRRWRLPWILAGGLTAATVGEAVRRSGAPAVDVSSGVERGRGRKNPALIAAFLAAARALPSPAGAETCEHSQTAV